jgi:aquaporin Z
MNGPAAPSQHWFSIFFFEWKRHGRHFEEYASEFIGTAFMVFCVVAVVGLMFATGSPVPAILPSTRLRLFLTGLMLGGSGWLVAVSPPGKLSGAHINPAISFGFWLLGKMHFRDLLGYITA